jgi:ACT domain-containing protein
MIKTRSFKYRYKDIIFLRQCLQFIGLKFKILFLDLIFTDTRKLRRYAINAIISRQVLLLGITPNMLFKGQKKIVLYMQASRIHNVGGDLAL